MKWSDDTTKQLLKLMAALPMSEAGRPPRGSYDFVAKVLDPSGSTSGDEVRMKYRRIKLAQNGGGAPDGAQEKIAVARARRSVGFLEPHRDAQTSASLKRIESLLEQLIDLMTAPACEPAPAAEESSNG